MRTLIKYSCNKNMYLEKDEMSFSVKIKIYTSETDEPVSPKSILSGKLLWKNDEYQIIKLDEPISLFFPPDSMTPSNVMIQYVRLNNMDNTVLAYIPYNGSGESMKILEHLLCNSPIVARYYQPAYNYMWEVLSY